MKHCVLTSLQDGLSVSPSIYNYAKPPKTTQNGQKTRWLQTDPQRTHLFACPGLFILTFSMTKQNWYDYFKILQQLGRIWIKKSLVFIINGAWACSYKCFGGRFQPGWSFRNKGHSRASHFPYIKSVTCPWFSHCRTDQTYITLEMPNRKK